MTATDTTATDLIPAHDRFYIGGAWVDPDPGYRTHDVVNATTEQVIARVPLGSARDVDRAVAAAQTGFHAWSQTDLDTRAQLLSAVHARLADQAERIAAVVTSEMGMPIATSVLIQAGMPAWSFGSMARLVRDFPWQEEIGNSLVVREPVGVVGAITPWNYPLHQVAAKVAPAIAAGCSVVLKPSEVAPLSAFLLAEILDEVGLPAGVFNLVTGEGPVVGEALAGHPDVDMISLTGSTRAGRRVGELAAQTVKRVSLELGGKSANIILDDVTGDELTQAVVDGIGKCFLNSGQTCTAFTRMLVPRDRLAQVEAIARFAAESATVGDPFDPATQLGPMVTRSHRETVRGYIRTGLDEGARLVTGGTEPVDGLHTGWFVRPTVFSDVIPGMTIEQEEIFGPVLSIIAYDSEDEAVQIANDTMYGLAGGVWGADRARAERVARRLRTGMVDINGGAFNPLQPFGGYKQSGNGRELGTHGLAEFTEVKAIQR
ncbi:putative Aldehyde dehydrogenase (NAD(+)) [Nostocoides japonicum T1-X7]|uniref:aldehyde dehydrogenase (NAD(+)) n=1 Tax=Nostocoides japonicum T1-X7 TaxID=1194083 RepID=A0A077M2C5_9MICO|nr:aldehyde dehydrogenase family protein [Tetrasphaera japonica]CCH79162.1 putative Aldehyde dehydrogenase (NAD(+)) [Tetrasphaera japonica T1-X7]